MISVLVINPRYDLNIECTLCECYARNQTFICSETFLHYYCLLTYVLPQGKQGLPGLDVSIGFHFVWFMLNMDCI